MKKVFVRHPSHSLYNHEAVLAHSYSDHGEKDSFTCPMHPSVRRTSTGFCPDCGIALEPLLDRGLVRDEFKIAQWHFYISFICSLVVLSMAMHELVFGLFLSQFIAPHKVFIELLFSMPVCLWAAWPLYVRGLWALNQFRLNMYTLISIGVGLTFIYSCLAVLRPEIAPHFFLDHNGQPQVYFDAAVVIVTLIWLGQVLELKARDQTSRAFRELMNLQPANARLVHSNGYEQDIELDLIKVGDVLRVRPGEKIPIDAVVLSGQTLVDESMISGERKPLDKAVGDSLIGASINMTGVLLIEAKKVASEMVLAQIIKLVSDAQRTKAHFQKLADNLAQIFVPIVIGIAILSFIVWFNVGPEPRFHGALLNAIAVLIIACPCALGLATPVSIMVAIGRGARAGVIFKNAEAIEQMAAVNTLVLDKTGTLTKGKISLSAVDVSRTINKKNLIKVAASLAQNSEHPLSKALVTYALKRDISLVAASHCLTHEGLGLSGMVENFKILVGTRGFLEQFNVDCAEFVEAERALAEKGSSVSLVAINGRVAGILGFNDELRESAAGALKTLKSLGLRIILATGDNEINARLVADAFSIKDVHAGVSPEGKASLVESLRRGRAQVAILKDARSSGAQAQAEAHVSIAMGNGTDAAIQNAHITLLKGDLEHVVAARKLSLSAMRNIKQNLFWAFFYNIVGVPIAAGILYPSFGTLLNPMIAAAAMSFSSISVIINALRLRTIRL